MISVVIIAHNEERYISQCIESLLNQTQKPDEIVLVAHNCTDRTFEIAKQYPIRIVPCDGPTGVVHARIKGIESVTGDYILCIDGDSFAQKNWVEVMSSTLYKNVLVGSWIAFDGGFFEIISNWFNRCFCVSKGQRATRWIWGASFAFHSKYKEAVIEILKRSINLSTELHLSRNPDDYWLALFMSKLGTLEVTNKTHVTAHIKEIGLKDSLARNKENKRNGDLMRLYIAKQIRVI